MGIKDVSVVKVFSCGCFVFWFIFTVFAIPFSIRTLETGKYAVPFTWTTQTIGSEVIQDAGLKFVGLGNSLQEYPSTIQTMYFVWDRKGISVADGEKDTATRSIVKGPIRARTKDGLEMQVSVSFQWRFQPEGIIPLNSILGHELYQDEFVRFARSGVVEACSLFPAQFYFTNRTAITEKMKEVLRDNFIRPQKSLSASIVGMQLREVDLPDLFDDEIANTQEQMQELEIASAERAQEIIAKERELLVASETMKKIIQIAQGTAEKIRLENQAQVKQLLILQERQAEANTALLQRFENSSAPFARLFELMELRAVDGHNADKLLMAM